MIKPIHKIYPVYFLIDLFIIAICFYGPYLLKYNYLDKLFGDANYPHLELYSSIFFLWLMFIIISFKRRSLYFTDRYLTIPKEVSRVVISIVYTSILIGAVIFFAQYKFFSREIFLKSFFLLCFCLSLWRVIKRLILRYLISMGFHNINVLIIGAGKVGSFIVDVLKRSPWWGFHVVGFLDDKVQTANSIIPVLGKLNDFITVTKKYFIDEVIITIPSERKVVAEVMKQARKMRLGVRIVPENFEEPMFMLTISHLGVLPILTYKERKHHPAEFALKRVFDFFISLILLILLFPVLLAIAIMIKFDSKGSVLYVQKRVGYKGRIINFYKFRSMVQGADKLKPQLVEKNEIKDGVIFKMKDDPRIIQVGRFLRKHSLDELPQLFNVLKGDMSLVGPRPPTPDEVEKYNHIHMQRLSIRPGITGLSQVRGRSELSFKKWVRRDLWYVNNWSFGFDLKILLWTIPAVFKGKGAY